MLLLLLLLLTNFWLLLQQGNQQYNQHYGHQNSKLAYFQLMQQQQPGYNNADQHSNQILHQLKQGQGQQFNNQTRPMQYSNCVQFIEPTGGVPNVRIPPPGYLPVYPLENPPNKVSFFLMPWPRNSFSLKLRRIITLHQAVWRENFMIF